MISLVLISLVSVGLVLAVFAGLLAILLLVALLLVALLLVALLLGGLIMVVGEPLLEGLLKVFKGLIKVEPKLNLTLGCVMCNQALDPILNVSQWLVKGRFERARKTLLLGVLAGDRSVDGNLTLLLAIVLHDGNLVQLLAVAVETSGRLLERPVQFPQSFNNFLGHEILVRIEEGLLVLFLLMLQELSLLLVVVGFLFGGLLLFPVILLLG